MCKPYGKLGNIDCGPGILFLIQHAIFSMVIQFGYATYYIKKEADENMISAIESQGNQEMKELKDGNTDNNQNMVIGNLAGDSDLQRNQDYMRRKISSIEIEENLSISDIHSANLKRLSINKKSTSIDDSNLFFDKSMITLFL